MPRRRVDARHLILALIAVALLAAPATADAKRHPVAVEAEFSFTGLAEYQRDTTGSILTCPDSPDPYRFEDHVRAHVAFDTSWQVRIPLKAGREQRVLESKTHKLNGSTWSINGKNISDSECVPPKPYSCSGTFTAAAKAPIFFTPIKKHDWQALMHGPGGVASTPDTCDYEGIHRRILNDLPDEMLERAIGVFRFRTARLLAIKNKTVTGDFDYGSIPTDCGSDDMVTCTQSTEGSGGIRYHRLRIRYAR